MDSNNDMDDLFKSYLSICNKAMDKHKHDYPYRGIMAATKTFIGDNSIDIAVYDDLPKGAYSLVFEDNKLVNKSQPDNVKKSWRLNLSYVKKVVDNPEKYIDNPEQLDLDWLKSRFGF